MYHKMIFTYLTKAVKFWLRLWDLYFSNISGSTPLLPFCYLCRPSQHFLHTTTPEKNIPTFTLQQTSSTGSRLFEIREVAVTNRSDNSGLYLPHRKDYYFFFLVKKGSNAHWIDFVRHEVRPGHIYFTLPHQIHLKEQNVPIEGTLLAFTEEFLLTDGPFSFRELPILQNPDDRHGLKIAPADDAFLQNLFTQMRAEYDQEQNWKKGMLQSYLKIFLVHLSRLYQQQYPTASNSSDNPSLTRQFKALLDDNCHTLHQVSEYARLLHITPGHLNDTIRRQTGRNATSLIHERITLEAKRTLFHTDRSVKEIAWSLGFEDAAYFNRFFKRVAGQTPLDFRNTIRKKYQ